MRIRAGQWRQSQPDTSKMVRHTPNCIVIHEAGVLAGEADPVSKMQKLYKFSSRPDPKMGDVARGGKPAWGDVPYHFTIDKYGNVIEGRSTQFQPDTNTRELNPKGKINIMLDGSYNQFDKNNKPIPHDKFTARQQQVLRQTIKHVQDTLNIKNVVAHKHLASTTCPGEPIMQALAGIWTSCPP
jgi:hypothetical protein